MLASTAEATEETAPRQRIAAAARRRRCCCRHPPPTVHPPAPASQHAMIGRQHSEEPAGQAVVAWVRAVVLAQTLSKPPLLYLLRGGQPCDEALQGLGPRGILVAAGRRVVLQRLHCSQPAARGVLQLAADISDCGGAGLSAASSADCQRSMEGQDG